ncbi:hypothetical protein [Ornithinibacillus bavariensis]|uniref:hypothetical protein n=1 Tax=Ornithinibacillus bavariensis TaxID=545502 RepID=UPI003D1DA63B
MYSILLFVHVLSSLFLGTFLALPFVMNTLFSRTGDELKALIRTVLNFTQGGHYALIFLTISGGSMIMVYRSYPSKLWVVLAIVLLLMISGMVGMIQKNMKRIIGSENPEELVANHRLTLKRFAWLISLFIIAAIFIMTNRSLFY